MTGEGETNIIMRCQSPEMDPLSVAAVGLFRALRACSFQGFAKKKKKERVCKNGTFHTHAGDTSVREITGGA